MCVVDHIKTLVAFEVISFHVPFWIFGLKRQRMPFFTFLDGLIIKQVVQVIHVRCRPEVLLAELMVAHNWRFLNILVLFFGSKLSPDLVSFDLAHQISPRQRHVLQQMLDNFFLLISRLNNRHTGFFLFFRGI